MKNKFALALASLAWFAVILQLLIMLKNPNSHFIDTMIRFFSYFTLLTNLMVAVYFTYYFKLIRSEGPSPKYLRFSLTPLTVYIVIVGLVYQIALRPLWSPTGLQWVADELLHTVVPIMVFLFWYRRAKILNLHWKQLPYYLIWPSIYLCFIMFQGSVSGFYPYFFLDASTLSIPDLVINLMALLLVFLVISSLFILISARLNKKKHLVKG